ncbi:MAG TPA: hypothetical protein VK956_21185 [Verrucomicrobium sp.]|nr:hypothetical protein [Verrucomicrobium sp.]
MKIPSPYVIGAFLPAFVLFLALAKAVQIWLRSGRCVYCTISFVMAAALWFSAALLAGFISTGYVARESDLVVVAGIVALGLASTALGLAITGLTYYDPARFLQGRTQGVFAALLSGSVLLVSTVGMIYSHIELFTGQADL